MTRDSELEKWIYTVHTWVKHSILKDYLWKWIPSLGKYQKLTTGAPRKVCYFDGFAGRGEYIGEHGGGISWLPTNSYGCS